MSEWIDCKDRLPPLAEGDPKFSDYVLVHQSGYGRLMVQAEYSYQDRAWYDTDGEELIGAIPRWMPLPSLPEDAQ